MKKFIISLCFVMSGCQTMSNDQIQRRFELLDFQAVYQHYEHTVQFCLIQGEICKLKNMNKCKELTEICIGNADSWMRRVKKIRGWK